MNKPIVQASNAKTDKEISDCMSSWKQAMVGRDQAIFERLYGADLVYTHSNGKQETKAEAIDAVVNGKIRFESIDIADHSVRSYGSTAVSKCKITMKLNTDGNKTTVILDVLHVWVKDSGQWQLVGRQAVRLNP
jgi:ketosteroid isomerase-like protein